MKDKICLQPIFWLSKEIEEESPGVYKALPPQPVDGYWMGYYIELEYPGDTDPGRSIFRNSFIFSTPGWTWPNTLPFPDCHGDECKGILV